MHVTAGKADQTEVVDSTLLSQLQDGMSHMVMEGAEYPGSQALPLCNDQPLHEHIQGFLIQPLPQQTYTLQLQLHPVVVVAEHTTGGLTEGTSLNKT